MAIEPKSPTGGEHEKIRTLGKYQIVKRLGAGGMGAVFLATDTELKRAVALKVLPKDRAENPMLVRRFKAEAQAVAQLRHDNIVSIYDTGEIQGFPYLALEYVDGQDLLSLIEKRGPIPAKRSLKIIRQVTEALQHAYERNIIHRDIKPSNLLVQVNGTTKITDFGLARSVDDTLDTSITRAGTTVGTVDYISPEQACNSKSADIRSDLYSLGCTWYHMVTGQPPFPDGDMQAKIRGHINSPPPNPRRINPNVPEAYVAVMHQMMAKRPQDRYPTPADLLRDLDQVAGAVSSVNAELFDEPSGGGSFRDDDDEPPSKRDASSGQSKPRKSSKSSRDDARQEEAPSKINEKWRGRGGAVRKPTATRGLGGGADLESGDAVEEEVGTSRKSKKLPPRDRKEPGGFAIDLDVARIGFIAAIVIGAIGLFWFAFTRGGRWSSSSQGSKPVAAGEDGTSNTVVVPPPDAVNPGAPTAPQLDSSTKTNVVVNAVGRPNDADATRVVLAADPQQVDRQSTPFPGLDDLPDQTSAIAREFVPDWVYAIRNATVAQLPATTVEYPPRAGGEAAVDPVIQRLAGRERVVELKGTGPFILRPVSVQGCERLVLRAAEGSQPLLILKGAPDITRDIAHLQVTGGVLQLEGIHVLAPASNAEAPRVLFGAAGGTVVLQRCTVTVPNESRGIIVARAVDAAEQSFASRILLENCLIRGRETTAAKVRGERADVVVGGCVLANEAAPLVIGELVARAAKPAAAAQAESESPAQTVAGGVAPAAEPAAVQESAPPATRSLGVHVLASALWTNGEVFELQQPKSDAVGQASIRLRRSLAVSGDDSAATLLSLPEWPSRATTVSGQPRIAGLGWKQEHTWLAGWPALVRLGAESVQTPEDWMQFVGAPFGTGELDPNAAFDRTAGMEQTGWEQIKALQSRVPAEVASGGHVGVDAGLPVPPGSLIDKHLLLEGRPQLPDGYVVLPASAETIKHELKNLKQGLGELLNSAAVPNGVHVQLLGSGLVAVPSFELRNKTLRLEFVQSGEGAPLTIRPEPARGEHPDAWLTVEGGRLDLIGARIQASPSRSRESSPRLILARDCDLTIRNCSFEGPPTGESEAPGLVDWVQAAPVGSRLYAYIADCQFTGSQTLLSADVDGRLLSLSNNLFASQGNGLALRSKVGAAAIPRDREGWVLMEHNTLLFGEFAMQFAGPSSGRDSPAVRIQARENVFAPAPGSTMACLLRHPEGMSAQNLFDWWGDRNGFAPALKQFRLTGVTAEPAPEQNFIGHWRGFWPTEHVENSITGLNGVLLATVLTSLNNITPQLVSLSRSCTGYAGSQDGSAIGIRTDRVGPAGRIPTGAPGVPQVVVPGPGTPRTNKGPAF